MTRIYTKINRGQKNLSGFQNLTGLLYFRCSGNATAAPKSIAGSIPLHPTLSGLRP